MKKLRVSPLVTLSVIALAIACVIRGSSAVKHKTSSVPRRTVRTPLADPRATTSTPDPDTRAEFLPLGEQTTGLSGPENQDLDIIRHEIGARPSVVPGEIPDFAALRVARLADQRFWAREHGFWEDLDALAKVRDSVPREKYQEAVINLAVEYLGLNTSETEAFERATAQAVEELQRAESAMDTAILNLPPGLAKDEVAQRTMEIQQRYQQSKEDILANLNSTLGSPPFRNTSQLNRIRVRLEEWLTAAR